MPSQRCRSIAMVCGAVWLAVVPAGDTAQLATASPTANLQVEDVRAALEGMLRPEEREVVLGEAEVRELFKVPKMGVIAGCSVRSGVINRTGRVRVMRDSVEIYDGNISSLRRFKDDVKEVREGFECGIGVENFNDIKVGDVLECYRKEQVARTLTSAAGASA